MTLNAWIAAFAASLFVGAGLGWWIVNQILVRQFKARLQRATEVLRQEHASTDDKLRSAAKRATMELEQLRASIPKQMASATTEARATINRLEERLRHVHAEIDRLRPKVKSAELGDGFAATRPFSDDI